MSDTNPNAATILEWKRDIGKFAWDLFQFVPDVWQQEVFDAWNDPSKKRIALSACAGPGKTAVLAIAILHFITCFGDRGHHPKGVALSISADNLRDNLWAEVAKWQGRSPFLLRAFKWTAERLFNIQHPSTWFVSARSFPKSANADEQGRTLSGLHSEYIAYFLDESGDIPVNVAKSAEQGIGGNHLFAKIIQAGNPTSQSGMLYNAAVTNRHLWHVINITGDPDDPRRSPRISIEWAREQISAYGRDNPWVMAFILGQFPPGSINTLIPLELVEAAMSRVLRPSDFEHSQKRLGIDVARFGDDETVIFPRQGLQAFQPISMRGSTNPEIAARVVAGKHKWGSEIEFVDGTGGFGGGVIDAIRQAGHNCMEVQFAGRATSRRYYNKRTEMWFEMAEWMKRGGSLPRIDGLIREMSTPTYTLKNGLLLLEPKEMIKKRLGASPDKADALCTTFAIAEAPASTAYGMVLDRQSSRLRSEYDPFERNTESQWEPFS